MSKRETVYHLIILDESGSMNIIKTPTISGFNEILQTMKGAERQHPDQQHFVSLVTFNGMGIKHQLDSQPLATLLPLDEKHYQPDANTPLFDAIGKAVGRLREHLAHQCDYNVLVTIFTDGEENASKEYTRSSVKRLVEELKAQGNWTFTYIGTDHEVETVSTSISVTNVLRFEKTVEGLRDAFQKESKARMKYSQNITDGIKDTDGYYQE